MLSTTMTVESTTMPKSTAPREIRFAWVLEATIPLKATQSAKGILIAVINAAFVCPRKAQRTKKTSTIPTTRFSMTVCVVVSTRAPRS